MKQRKVNKQEVSIKAQTKKQLKSHELLTDNLKRKRIRIYLYKGEPIASKELVETDVSDKKLRLIRIRVDFMQLRDNISIDMLTVKDNIEQLDIDFKLLEQFFRRYFDSYQMRKLFAPLIDLYDYANTGDLIGDITLEYHQFIELVNFLEFLLKEPLKNDKCI